MESTETPKNPLALKFPDLKPTLDTLAFLDGSFESIPAGKHAIAVMGEAGDTKHMWDKSKPVEVEAARTLFTSLTKNGYRAFRVEGKDGDKGDLMDKFEPDAERILFVPQMGGG